MLITDCRSLYDHLQRTESSTTEKRVALDLDDVRQGVDGGGDQVRWQDTDHMCADGLTKHDPEQAVLAKIIMGGHADLREGHMPLRAKDV